MMPIVFELAGIPFALAGPGSAAGYEARLRLAVRIPQSLGLLPWLGLRPINVGPRPNQGHSPFVN